MRKTILYIVVTALLMCVSLQPGYAESKKTRAAKEEQKAREQKTSNAASSFSEFKKTRIAVLDFQLQGKGYDTPDMGKIVAEWLITAMVKEGRFDVIERRLMEKIIEEQKFGTSGLVDEGSASRLGKIVGAKVVITGSVMRFQNIMEVNARIIDVEDSSIIAAENVKSTSAVKLEDLVIKMAEKIITDFPLQGYIVSRDGDKVIIDLGKRSGVKHGMQFIVFKEGKVIKHPKTGEVLDVERIETGSVEISDLKDKTATGVVTKEIAPQAIQYGQMVRNISEMVPEEKPVETSAAETGRTGKAGKARKAGKAGPSDIEVQTRLNDISLLIEEARRLKEDASLAEESTSFKETVSGFFSASPWKAKLKEVFVGLKPLLAANPSSAEVYLSYARAFYVEGKTGAAEKYLNRAFEYRPQYIDAYIFKGDMYFDLAKKQGKAEGKSLAYGSEAREAYLAALNASPDKNQQALIYLKLGNVQRDLDNDREKSKESWQKAIAAAPDSPAALRAKEQLER